MSKPFDIDDHGFRPFTETNDAPQAMKEAEKEVQVLTPYYKTLYHHTNPRQTQASVYGDYVGSGYSSLNSWLVSNPDWCRHRQIMKSFKSVDLQQRVLDLWELVDSFKLPKRLTVFRGTSDFNYEKDRIYHNPCFMSTSLNENVSYAFHKGSLTQLIIPQGHPALFVERSDRGEMEIILPPRTQFKVYDKANQNLRGRKVVLYKAKVFI